MRLFWYLSTDYVFGGQGTEPWRSDCKDYRLLNVYGQTKLEGELAVANTIHLRNTSLSELHGYSV